MNEALSRLRASLPKRGNKFTRAEATLDLYLDDLAIGKRRELKDYVKRWVWPKSSTHRLLNSTPIASNSPPSETKKETAKKDKAFRDKAVHILNEFNNLAGSSFQLCDRNIKPIVARLKEHNCSVEDVMLILKDKSQNQYFKDNNFFNPITIFRPSNFEKYLNAVKSGNSKGGTLDW